MYVIVTLSSVTSAKRLERALNETGIVCNTLHTPKMISQYGCSHSVRINKNDVDKVLKLCREIGINMRGVYAEISSGKGMTEYEKIN